MATRQRSKVPPVFKVLGMIDQILVKTESCFYFIFLRYFITLVLRALASHLHENQGLKGVVIIYQCCLFPKCHYCHIIKNPTVRSYK